MLIDVQVLKVFRKDQNPFSSVFKFLLYLILGTLFFSEFPYWFSIRHVRSPKGCKIFCKQIKIWFAMALTYWRLLIQWFGILYWNTSLFHRKTSRRDHFRMQEIVRTKFLLYSMQLFSPNCFMNFISMMKKINN